MQVSNDHNIEVWIVYRNGNQFDWHVTMVEMPASTYNMWSRGEKVEIKYCRTSCCVRAEPKFTCRRFCITLIRDRLIDTFLLICIIGGIICICTSLETGEEAELLTLIVIPILTCLCISCCCLCNLGFLRNNKYSQHLAEVIATDRESLLEKFMDRAHDEEQQKDKDQEEISVELTCNTNTNKSPPFSHPNN